MQDLYGVIIPCDLSDKSKEKLHANARNVLNVVKKQNASTTTKVIPRVLLLSKNAPTQQNLYKHLENHKIISKLYLVAEAGHHKIGHFEKQDIEATKLAQEFFSICGEAAKRIQTIIFLSCNAAYHPGIFDHNIYTNEALKNADDLIKQSALKSFAGQFFLAMKNKGAENITVLGALGFIKEKKGKKHFFVSKVGNEKARDNRLKESDFLMFHLDDVTLPPKLLEPEINHKEYYKGLKLFFPDKNTRKTVSNYTGHSHTRISTNFFRPLQNTFSQISLDTLNKDVEPLIMRKDS